MSDSESSEDDLLDALPIFNTRKRKSADRKRAEQLNLLDQMVGDSNRRLATHSRMAQIKQEHDAHHDHEELRARASELTQNVGGKKRCRRETVDAMEGLEADTDNALGYLRRKELAEAIDTDKSDFLGFRRTIHFDPTRSKGIVKFYRSDDEAIEDLRKLMGEQESSSDSRNEQEIQQQNEIIKKLNFVLQEEVFWDFLSEKQFLKLLVTHHTTTTPLHFLLLKWLNNLSQSSGVLKGSRLVTDHAIDAFNTLESLIRQKNFPAAKFGASLETFCANLECWVNLRHYKNKPCIDHNKADQDQDALGMNIPGLVNMLKIYELSIPLLPLSTCSTYSETIATCIVLLTRLGLDEAVSSNSQSFRLRHTLEKIMSSLLKHATEHITANKGDEIKWMKTTAASVLQDLSDLGPGEDGADDDDDKNAWLCHPATIGILPNGTKDVCSNRFKALLALRTLETLLGTENFTKKTETILSESGNTSLSHEAASSLTWLAIFAPLVAFTELIRPENDISKDGPRCLATVKCAVLSFESGMILLKGSGTWTTAENASRERVLELLGSRSSELCRRVSPLANQAHFRRVDYILSSFGQYVRKINNNRASLLSSPVQKSMHSFLKPTPTLAAT